jgi:hypothetical protein
LDNFWLRQHLIRQCRTATWGKLRPARQKMNLYTHNNQLNMSGLIHKLQLPLFPLIFLETKNTNYHSL